MIIKSLSRKAASFGQLTDYMLAENGAQAVLYHNLPANARIPENIVAAFEENHACLPKRANGNSLFHEIIALEPGLNIAVKEQAAALVRIAERYLNLRAPTQLAYGVVHTGTAHVHLHLMVSSNAVFSKKRAWLTKKKFATIQREVEAYQIEHFPQLGTTRLYDTSRDGLKRSNREQAASIRTGKSSAKEQLTAQLADIFEQTKNRADLEKRLATLDVRLYQRGRTVGVQTVGGRKYRLKTLGLSSPYAEAMARIELAESRMAQLRRSRATHQREGEREI